MDTTASADLCSSSSRKRKIKNASHQSSSSSKKPKVAAEGPEATDGAEPVAAKDLPRNVREQAASYALEMLANTSGTRTHVILLIIRDTRVQFWYYDAAGIIHTDDLDFVDEFEKFAAIIIAMSQLSAGQWGVGDIPGFDPPLVPKMAPMVVSLPTSLAGYTTKLPHPQHGEITVTLVGEEIWSQYCLVGRQTIVYGVTCATSAGVPIEDYEMVLKMSMQVCSREPEQYFINKARSMGVKHLPEVFLSSEKKSERRISEGVRGLLMSPGEGKYEDRYRRLLVVKKYDKLHKCIVPENFHLLFMQLLHCESQISSLSVPVQFQRIY